MAQKEFKDFPFHNSLHACHSTASIIFLLKRSELINKLDPLDNFATTIACLCHDIEHPWVSNNSLIAGRSQLAIQYNDISILENYHAALTFQIMLQTQEANVLNKLDNREFGYARKIIIEMILATDMQQHFKYMALFQLQSLHISNFD